MGVWGILGLAPTADTRAIKRAYAALLKQVHPEDDPEGFQRLREAYGEALELAKTLTPEEVARGQSDASPAPDSPGLGGFGRPNEEAGPRAQAAEPSPGALPVWGQANRLARRRREETVGQPPHPQPEASAGDRTPIPALPEQPAAGEEREAEVWIGRFEQLYGNYTLRIQTEAWRELLEQERLQQLAFKQAFQPRLLVFLAEHPYLPRAVWRMLDRIFYWTDDEIGLARLVPPGFAAFMLDSIRQASELRFDYLPKGADFDQDEFLGLRSRGAARLRSGSLEEALEDFDAAFRLFAGDPDLLRLRATALHLMGDDEKAEIDWASLVGRYPQERDALMRLADLMLESDRASDALRLYQRALDLLPNDPHALLGLARCYRELERFAESFQVCELALLLEPSDIELRIRLLELLEQDLERQLVVLKRYPGDKETRAAAAECLFELERYAECERLLTEAPLYGWTSAMKTLLGRTLWKLGRREEAGTGFNEAVALAEAAGQSGYEARLHRGMYRMEIGQTESAEEDLRLAAALGPGSPQLAAAWGRCAFESGRFEESAAWYGRALQSKPDSAYYAGRGRALHKLERYAEAIEDLERRLSVEPDSQVILQAHGDCLAKLGRPLPASSRLELPHSRGRSGESKEE
ncbi:tetratricopeptide repeat protein [Saccharibacillus qingshengii]|uniref:tetratricopeptide repeat protein n=1 Tax=Saccharibacillus qingshengii TaxID=1763540 RepID=UPI00155824F2|nr:tetratricopeptide repeat protein [Saccharibacillus qingshengii]